MRKLFVILIALFMLFAPWVVLNKALAEQLCNYRKASDPR